MRKKKSRWVGSGPSYIDRRAQQEFSLSLVFFFATSIDYASSLLLTPQPARGAILPAVQTDKRGRCPPALGHARSRPGFWLQSSQTGFPCWPIESAILNLERLRWKQKKENAQTRGPPSVRSGLRQRRLYSAAFVAETKKAGASPVKRRFIFGNWQPG